MQILKNGMDMSIILDDKSLYEAYPSLNIDECYASEAYEEYQQYCAMEGILWDSAKGVSRAARAIGRAGRQGYKAVKRQYRSYKDKWAKIKPMIIKAIKDLGITLSNMYGRFMKYDKDYTKLAEQIRNVINVKVPLLGQTKSHVYIDIYNINIDTLSNVCKMIESYEGFVALVKNESNLLNKQFIEPEDFLKIVTKNCNFRTGEFNAGPVESRLNEMISAIGKLNEKGEITIPNNIWTNRKWYIPTNIPLAKKRNADKNRQEAMDQSTAAGFTKMSITGEMEELTFDPGSLETFKKLLVKPNNTGYLQVMESFLNNRIIEKTLKRSGSSIKKETNDFFKEMNKCTNEFEQLQKKMAEARDKANEGKKVDETINDDSPTDPKVLKKKRLDNSDDGMMSDNENGLDTLIESYFEAMTSFFMGTSSVYRSMVNGLLAASFDIIVNCKSIVDRIDSLTNIPKDKVGGV